MPTNDRKINIYHKRLLSMTAIKSNFLEFLEGEINEATAAVYQGTSGVLDGDEIELNNDSGGSTFDLDLTDAYRVIVGTGQIIDLSKITGVGITEGIPFENTTSAEYQVGIKFAEIEDGIEANPITGDAEYPSIKQTYGDKGIPGSVVDNTTYIRLNINSITESGVDYSGRTIRCWLVDPVSLVEAIAYYEGTSAYSSPNNYVDIPYSGSNGPLGQDTGVDPPSTTAADYVIFIEGATWRKNYSIAGDSDYAFLGTATGGATPGFSITGQQPIFINTLDRAYDGASGNGSGRIMSIDNGAVEMNTQGGSLDEHNAQLRLNRMADTFDGGLNLELIHETSKGCGLAVFRPLTHSIGNLTVANAIETDNPDDVIKTGSVDWAASNVQMGSDLALIQGTPTSDGLFLIVDVTATTLKLRKTDGTTPAFVDEEVGNVTVLRAMHFSGSDGFAAGGHPGLMMNAFSGLNEDTDPPTYAAVEIHPLQSNGLHARRYDGGAFPIITKINKDAALETREASIIPVKRSSPSLPDAGLILNAENLDLDTTKGSLGKIVDPEGGIPVDFGCFGRIAKSHMLEDDFTYHPLNWVSAATCPPNYKGTVGGSGSGGEIRALDANTDGNWPKNWGGVAKIKTNDGSGAGTLFEGNNMFILNTNWAKIRFMARYAIDSAADRSDFLGLATGLVGTTGKNFGFSLDGGNWKFYANDGTNSILTSALITGPLNQYMNIYFAVVNATTVHVWIEGMSSPVIVDLSLASPGAITLAGVDDYMKPYVSVTTNAAANKTGFLDYWMIWDNEAIRGALPVTPS